MLRRQTRTIARTLVLAALTMPACLLAQRGGGTVGTAGAQGVGRAATTMWPLQVRTFMLQSLSPKDAATLVGPYVSALSTGGVFEAGGIHAITVRGTSDILIRIDSLLKANDRPRATITLRFQLIAASDSAVRDPAIAGLDGELRSLLRFAGYRLLAQGTAIANDQQQFELTLGSGSTGVYEISGMLTAVQTAGGKGDATMKIYLNKRMSSHGMLLSTGLTVPLGQTVVIGSAASDGSVPALVLAVRPELTSRP